MKLQVLERELDIILAEIRRCRDPEREAALIARLYAGMDQHQQMIETAADLGTAGQDLEPMKEGVCAYLPCSARITGKHQKGGDGTEGQ